jgi:hypothetical protein
MLDLDNEFRVPVLVEYLDILWINIYIDIVCAEAYKKKSCVHAVIMLLH